MTTEPNHHVNPTQYHPLLHVLRPDAARRLGRCPDTLRNWERQGRLSPIRFDARRIGYVRQDFDRLASVLARDATPAPQGADPAALHAAARAMASAATILDALGEDALAGDLSAPRAAPCLHPLPPGPRPPSPLPAFLADARVCFFRVSGSATPADFARVYPPSTPRDTLSLRVAVLDTVVNLLTSARPPLLAHGSHREARALRDITRKVRRRIAHAARDIGTASEDPEPCTLETALLRLLVATVPRSTDTTPDTPRQPTTTP